MAEYMSMASSKTTKMDHKRQQFAILYIMHFATRIATRETYERIS